MLREFSDSMKTSIMLPTLNKLLEAYRETQPSSHMFYTFCWSFFFVSPFDEGIAPSTIFSNANLLQSIVHHLMTEFPWDERYIYLTFSQLISWFVW